MKLRVPFIGSIAVRRDCDRFNGTRFVRGGVYVSWWAFGRGGWWPKLKP